MSKDLNIEKVIMEKISSGKIKMRPRLYFIVGSILTFAGLIATVIISTFMVSLIKFSIRTNGGWRAEQKLGQMISEFPWWTILIAVFGLILGIWIIKKLNFAHKIKPWVLILVFILAIFIAGLITDKTRINDTIIMKNPPMKKMMKLENPRNKDFPRNQNWKK